MALYEEANRLKLGVGGPDLLPYKPGQMNHAYTLIRAAAGLVPTGIAVQDGNYEHVNPRTGKQISIPELIGFATEHLKVNYIFWCAEEQFYSANLIPFLQKRG